MAFRNRAVACHEGGFSLAQLLLLLAEFFLREGNLGRQILKRLLLFVRGGLDGGELGCDRSRTSEASPNDEASWARCDSVAARREAIGDFRCQIGQPVSPPSR